MYTTQQDVLGKIARSYLDDALLDDDGKIMSKAEQEQKKEEVWQSIVSAAATEIHGYLAQQYPVPFAGDSVPALVRTASLLFVLESLFQRRGYFADDNLYTAQADKLRLKLDRVGQGLEPLQAGTKKAGQSVIISSLPVRAGSRRNS